MSSTQSEDPPPYTTTSTALTHGARVDVTARYSAAHSDPTDGLWFFLYTIRISNQGSQAFQLTHRHWIITDATGEVQEVRGEGVIGEQPVLEPGQAFEYTSGCPLNTPFGNMRGSYRLVRSDGSDFECEIAQFELAEPSAIH